MESLNFSAWMAQQRVLEASDIVPADDLIAIGKKIKKRRDGEQYQEFGMSIEEFGKTISSPLAVTNYYVDAAFGDDTTALPNRFDKPYATLNAAHAATIDGTAALIYVRRGAYTGKTINQKNLVDWYFEPGTVVTNMTFQDGGPKTFNIYGKANFVMTDGSFLMRIIAASTVTFEANDITSTDRIFQFGANSEVKIDMTVNSITSSATDGGSGFIITRRTTANINIKKSYIYGTQNGDATASAFRFESSFNGTCNITCPLTKVITQQSAINITDDNSGSAKVTYTGNIEMAGTSTTSFRFAVYVGGSNFTMVGNINTSLLPEELAIGILTGGAAENNTGTVKLTGSIIGGGEALITTSSFIPVFLQNGTYSTAVQGNYYKAVINIGRTTNDIVADNANIVYIKDGFIKIGTANQPIFFDDATQLLYLYNVSIQVLNTGDDCTDGGAATMFCQNVVSNGKQGVAIGPSIAAEFKEQSTLIVPAF